MKKYRNKYRISSSRANWWDYGENGSYFVTICTANRHHFFGSIRNSKVQLSKIGQIAESCWRQIPDHFPFVHLDVFVVMPNHVHGIIGIRKLKNNPNDGQKRGNDSRQGDQVETQNIASLPRISKSSQRPPFKSSISSSKKRRHKSKNEFGPQSGNLASIVRGYKTGVTKYAKSINPAFRWQARFHDHIIKNIAEYKRILKYIENNPRNWENDKFN